MVDEEKKLTGLIVGVDLDGVCADFYARMREVAAEWFERPLDELPTDVTYGLKEWGVKNDEEYLSLHRFAVTQRDLFKRAPMMLRGDGGGVFTLAPAGYEFPVAVSDHHDDNWLNVTAKASFGAVSWGGTDPCLLTWELRGLCTWLRSHAEGGGTAASELDFMEPELMFEVVERGADAIRLRITMRHALSRSVGGENPETPERVCELQMSRVALASAAEELAREANAHPER